MDADTGVAMRGVRALMGIVARSLGQALEQVTPAQLRVLVLLRAIQRIQVGELAGILALSPSGATRAAARMERDGWVRRVRAADDRRAVSVSLTPAGRTLVDGVLQAREAELAAALDRLSAEDRAAVLRGLVILADALGEPADDVAMQTLGFPPGEGAASVRSDPHPE